MHAQSNIQPPRGAGESARRPQFPQASPLQESRFGWIALDGWILRDEQAGGHMACAVLTAAGQHGHPAEQAMPAFATTLGLDPRPGEHTDLPTEVYVTLSEHADQSWMTQHVRTNLVPKRPVVRPWHQTASMRGWVRVVIGYRALAADADGVEHLDDALTGHGVTADVPVRTEAGEDKGGPLMNRSTTNVQSWPTTGDSAGPDLATLEAGHKSYALHTSGESPLPSKRIGTTCSTTSRTNCRSSDTSWPRLTSNSPPSPPGHARAAYCCTSGSHKSKNALKPDGQRVRGTDSSTDRADRTLG